MAEREEELKRLLIKVKEESEKVGLKFKALAGPPGSLKEEGDHAARILPQPIIHPALSASPSPRELPFSPKVSVGLQGECCPTCLPSSAWTPLPQVTF